MRFFKKKSDKRKCIPFCDLNIRINAMSSPGYEEIEPVCISTAVHPGGEEVKTVTDFLTKKRADEIRAELKASKPKKKVKPKAKVKAKPIAAKKSKPKPRREPNGKVHQKNKRGKSAR
ncbi:MAG: hypothetical protein ABGX83_05205 [Nitrospira sp.]